MSDAPGQRYQVIESLERQFVGGRGLPAFWEISLGRRDDEETFSLVFEMNPLAEIPRGYLASVRQRYDQLLALQWPSSGRSLLIAGPLQAGHLQAGPLQAGPLQAGPHDDGLVLLTAAIEGESLPHYLTRRREYPEAVLFPLFAEVTAALRTLVGAPRLFANAEFDDFQVVAADGVLLGVRFCPALSLLREEVPLSDYHLARKWTEQMARAYAFVKQAGKTPLAEVEAVSAKPFRSLFKELESGKDCTLEERLRRIEEIFRQDSVAAAKGSGSGKGRVVPLVSREEFPLGPLSRLLINRARLAHPDKLPLPTEGGDRRPSFSAFVLEAASGTDALDRLGYLLPPEQWDDFSLVDPVNRRLSHPFLKAHHNAIRLRSVYCDEGFTVLFGDLSAGLPLPSLLTCLGGFSREDLFLLTGKLHRAHAQFDSTGFDLALVSPWQVELHIEQGVSHPGWDGLLGEAIESWPPWEVKLRVERPTESFLSGPGEESWRRVFHLLNGKFFPALVAWMLDWKRFQWSAAQGTIAGEPVSWDKRLEALFEAAGEHLAPNHTAQRERFLAFVREGTDPTP